MPGRETCGGSHAELRGVERLVAPWFFAGAGGGLVRRFKLDGDRAAGQLVVRAMANAWRESARGGWRRAVLVSVPLHPDRLRQRGFDQAQWLAAGIARRLRQPLVMGALRRQRATLPQGDPRVTSRSRNVEGAFAVHCADAVQGRQVLLVDDVFTSGTTAVECARILREAGAREVAVLVACRS